MALNGGDEQGEEEQESQGMDVRPDDLSAGGEEEIGKNTPPPPPPSRTYVSPLPPPPTVDELDTEATLRWERVLNVVVGTPGTRVDPKVKRILVDSGLMSRNNNTGGAGVGAATATGSASASTSAGAHEKTALGFRFLLDERRAQLWFYALYYARSVGAKHGTAGLVDALAVVLSLAFCTIGRQLAVAEFTRRQHGILAHLAEIGLAVLLTKKKKQNDGDGGGSSSSDGNEGGGDDHEERRQLLCYPTPLAALLTSAGGRSGSGSGGGTEGGGSKGGAGSLAFGGGIGGGGGGGGSDARHEAFLLVETNFRVFAYTDRPLQVELLRTFVQVTHRLAGCVVGRITRASVRRALMAGISAAQLLHFMQVHAHPRMHEGSSVLLQNQRWRPIPTTISDQIHLWQDERNRLREAAQAVRYKLASYLGADVFAAVKKDAQQLGGLLWSDDTKRVLIVRQTVHRDLKLKLAELIRRAQSPIVVE
eukprot:UC1_evm2s1729